MCAFCSVLGGGVVPGSLVLVGGDPGVGKSTLMLQVRVDHGSRDGTGTPKMVVTKESFTCA